MPSAAEDESTEPSELPTETQEKTEPQVVEYWSSEDGAFRIPQLEMEGEYAAQINAEILEQYDAESMRNGARDAFSSVDYTWARNGHILSLAVIGKKPGSDDNICFVCNIDINTGKEAPNEQVYGYAGFGEWEYSNQVGLALSKFFARHLRQSYLDAPDTVLGEDLQEAFENMLSVENLAKVKPWLDENGYLWCCGTVYLADGEEITHMMCLTKDAEPQVVQTQEITAQVVELYRGESTYTDTDGNPEQHIPFLLAPGGYADEVNAQLLYNYFGQRRSMGSITYAWAINGRFLSLAVNAESAVYEGNICYATNIDIQTGDEVSYDAVYGSLGFTGEEYRALVKKALLNQFVTLLGSDLMSENMMGQINDCITRTAEEANLRSATPYLDSEGKLWIWGRVYQLAGAAYQEYLLPLTDYDLSPAYSEYIDE